MNSAQPLFQVASLGITPLFPHSPIPPALPITFPLDPHPKHSVQNGFAGLGRREMLAPLPSSQGKHIPNISWALLDEFSGKDEFSMSARVMGHAPPCFLNCCPLKNCLSWRCFHAEVEILSLKGST